VRAGVATEGNGLMARLLDAGNFPFLSTKLVVGALVAYTLYRSPTSRSRGAACTSRSASTSR
jgi:hypothetical protein